MTMGQRISIGIDEKSLLVQLDCDGQGHLLKEGWMFIGTNYMAIMKDARNHGWRRIQGGEWRGPCCP